jgi:hypothetical protein
LRRLSKLLRQSALDQCHVDLELLDPAHLLVEAVDQRRGQTRLHLREGGRKLLEQRSVSLRDDDSEFVEQTAQLVSLHDPHLHQLRTQAMKRKYDLLRLTLDWNEPRARLLAGRPDRPGVGSVGLVAMNEGTHHLRRQETHFVPEL